MALSSEKGWSLTAAYFPNLLHKKFIPHENTRIPRLKGTLGC